MISASLSSMSSSDFMDALLGSKIIEEFEITTFAFTNWLL